MKFGPRLRLAAFLTGLAAVISAFGAFVLPGLGTGDALPQSSVQEVQEQAFFASRARTHSSTRNDGGCPWRHRVEHRPSADRL